MNFTPTTTVYRLLFYLNYYCISLVILPQLLLYIVCTSAAQLSETKMLTK